MRVKRSNLGTIVCLNKNDNLYETVRGISIDRDEEGMTRLICLFRNYKVFGENIKEYTLPIILEPEEEGKCSDVIMMFPSTSFCNSAPQHKTVIKAMLMQLNETKEFEEVDDGKLAKDYLSGNIEPSEYDIAKHRASYKKIKPKVERYYTISEGDTYLLTEKNQIFTYEKYATAFYKYKNRYYMIAKERVLMDDFLQRTDEDVTTGMLIKP